MILAQIKDNVPYIDFSLYRDDGLAVMKSGKGCHVEKTKKKLIQIFKSNGLKIYIKMRLHKVDFLDLTLN